MYVKSSTDGTGRYPNTRRTPATVARRIANASVLNRGFVIIDSDMNGPWIGDNLGERWTGVNGPGNPLSQCASFSPRQLPQRFQEGIHILVIVEEVGGYPQASHPRGVALSQVDLSLQEPAQELSVLLR